MRYRTFEIRRNSTKRTITIDLKVDDSMPKGIDRADDFLIHDLASADVTCRVLGWSDELDAADRGGEYDRSR